MNTFISGSEMMLMFHNCLESDIFIRSLGYNDFHYVEPIRTVRRQNFYTIHLIFNGSGTLKLAGKEYAVKEHSMFCVPPDVDLAYYPDDDNLWDYMWFEFIGPNSKTYVSGMGFSLDNPVIVCRDFESLNLAAYNIFMRPNFAESVRYYDVLSLFYKFVASSNFGDETGGVTTVENAVSYIAYHYHNQNFSIENLCRDLHISHAHLCRMFKNSTGKTPVGYLLKVRMDEAGRMLRYTDMHINEIAYSVGFKDGVHFMKTFKKHMGCTPGDYRKKVRQ